VVRPQGFEP